MRRLLGAVAYASTLTILSLAAVSGSVTAAEPARAGSMQFALRIEGPASSCGDKCRTWVAASGMIRPETATDFENFALKNDIRGATIALESEGGSVLGAIALGRSIRRLGMTTTVGRSTDLPNGRATLSSRADCESMCAFVLLAGAKRVVPAEARVRVHQIWLGDRREDATAAVYSAEDLVIVQRDIGRLAQYTAEMGGSTELLEVSLRIPPWEPMRALTRDELRRMRLDNVEFADAGQPAIPTGTAAPTGTNARKISLAVERSWAIADRAGAATLTRRHPLTVEGEEIGSLEVSIACGAKPTEYVVSYNETRHIPQGGAAPEALRSVDVRIGQKTTALAIASSSLNEQRAARVSAASGVVPGTLIKALAENGNRSLTVTASTVDNAVTTIRIGNTGVAANLAQLAAACAAAAPTTHAGLARAEQ
jgi:hypothetical protein